MHGAKHICSIVQNDLIVRELAKRVVEIAASPAEAVKVTEWTRHNALNPGRPLIVQAPEGVWGEFVPDDSLLCEDKLARRVEQDLRTRIYHHEHFRDDEPISDAMFADLGNYFSEGAQLEIVSVIALFGFLNRWNSTLATDLESLPQNALSAVNRDSVEQS